MAANGQDQQRENHLISLKVMRLSRPSLTTGHSLYFGSPAETAPASAGERPNVASILTDALSELSLKQLERVHPPSSTRPTQLVSTADSTDSEVRPDGGLDAVDIGDFGVSELLTLPAAFGHIYLGETFSSYICANNESAHPVRDVILRAELQTSTSRFSLSDTLANQRVGLPSATTSNAGHIQLLESGKTNEMIVSHEIKELGIHILVCSIQYTTLDGQQKSFRKFYKFQVLNPLSVKTKVNQPSSHTVTVQDSGGNSSISTANTSRGGLVLLEAMVQNVSGVTLWMERMRFEVADAFTVRDLNVVTEEEDEGSNTESKDMAHVSIFGKHDYFAPNDVRQYLYVLTPKPGKEQLAKTTNILGKMDILWRSQFGETGRLQTSQLTRKPTPLDSITVQVVKVPEKIRLEEIFTIEVVVKNQSVPSTTAAPQQQPQSASGNPLSRQSSSSGGPVFGGMLARPPAAVARGGVVSPNRPLDSSTSSSQLSLQSAPQEQNTMKLMLTGVKQKMGAILLSGPNSRQLGAVPAGGEVRVRLDWFPLTSGVQKIGGIRIADIVSGYSIELDHLTSCFVEHT